MRNLRVTQQPRFVRLGYNPFGDLLHHRITCKTRGRTGVAAEFAKRKTFVSMWQRPMPIRFAGVRLGHTRWRSGDFRLGCAEKSNKDKYGVGWREKEQFE